MSLRSEIPFPALSGDWFDDWVVGHQFVPYNLHHAVSGFKTRSSFSDLLRRNGGFLHSLASLHSVSAPKKAAFAAPSLQREIPFPAPGGDRFDDWMGVFRLGPEAIPD